MGGRGGAVGRDDLKGLDTRSVAVPLSPSKMDLHLKKTDLSWEILDLFSERGFGEQILNKQEVTNLSPLAEIEENLRLSSLLNYCIYD